MDAQTTLLINIVQDTHPSLANALKVKVTEAENQLFYARREAEEWRKKYEAAQPALGFVARVAAGYGGDPDRIVDEAVESLPGDFDLREDRQ